MTITSESFLKDVAGHRFSLIQDQPPYRHLRFRAAMGGRSFEIVTWPGTLCLSTPVRSFTFACLPDMFDFFRRDDLADLDYAYWADKCLAASEGPRRYCPRRFQAVIREWLRDAGASASVQRAAIEAFRYADSTEESARLAVQSFAHEGFRFNEFWRADLHDFSDRFVWCCHAVAWGVRQYDHHHACLAMSTATAPTTPASMPVTPSAGSSSSSLPPAAPAA